MRKTMKVEFEGTDGAGKTTALKYFIEEARKRDLTVTETREVGNPNIASCVKLREFVLDPASKLSGMAMEFIFAAMRIENDLWFKDLTSKSDAPDLVVSDRGWFSHLAYTDHNESEVFTEQLYTDLLQNITLLPDIVLYFNVSTDTALKRRIKRGEGMDVIEMKGVPFQDKVRASFRKYIDDANPAQLLVFEVDADDTIEGVRGQIDTILGYIEHGVKATKTA